MKLPTIRVGIALAALALIIPGIALADTITNTIPVASGPFSEALNSSTSRLYVGSALSPDTGTISVVDTANNTLLTNIPTSANRAMDMTLSPDGSRLYTGHFSGQIRIINTSTNTIQTSGSAGSSIYGIALSTDGTKLYTSDFTNNLVRVLNATTLSPITTISIGTHPRLMALSSDGTRAYVAVQGATATSQGNVKVVDTASNTVIATIPTGLGTAAVALSPDGKKIYATNLGSNNVSVIDTTTNTVSTTIPVGTQPYQVRFTPDGTRAYVANALSNNVSVINVAADAVVSTITVGTTPQAVRIAANSQTAYVSNQASNTVSVIALDTFPGITTTTLTNGAVGSTYTGSIVATGRPAPAFTVTGGTFPPGLTLNTDGSITGTPTAAGTYSFTVTAASSVSGIPSTAAQTLSITIAPAPIANGQTSTPTLANTGENTALTTNAAIFLIVAGGTLFLIRRTGQVS